MTKFYQRDIFIDTLFNYAKEDSDIIFVSADFGAPALDKFREQLPNQFIHSGISEQHMIDMAAGLSLAGKKVYVYAMAPFISLRCIEQIKCSLAMMHLPVSIISVGGGLSYADAGPTHYSNEDIASIRSLVGIDVISPSDNISANKIVLECINNPKLRFIRLEREPLYQIYKNEDIYNDDKGFELIGKDSDTCVISYGYIFNKFYKFFNENNLSITLIDLFKIKPIENNFLDTIKNFKKIITLEEHCASGGFGSAVLEFLSDNDLNLPVKRFFLEEKYYFENGGRDYLLNKSGLSFDEIKKYIELQK